jgi:hypothetical protein
MTQMPYFVHIHLASDGGRAGDLLRFIQKTSKDFTTEGLKKFKEDVKNGQV